MKLRHFIAPKGLNSALSKKTGVNDLEMLEISPILDLYPIELAVL
jgi:hypothetical protein